MNYIEWEIMRDYRRLGRLERPETVTVMNYIEWETIGDWRDQKDYGCSYIENGR